MMSFTITNTKHIVPSANISAVKLTAMTFIWLFNCHLDVLVINTVLFIFTDVYWYKNIFLFLLLITIMKNFWEKNIRRIIIENLIMTCIILLIISNLILLLIGHLPNIRTCIHVYEISRYLLPLQLLFKYDIWVIF